MNTIPMKSAAQHFSTAVASGIAFWAVTAWLVLMVDQRLAHVGPAACLTAKIVIIITIALAYVRLGAHDATFDHALFTGIGWAVLSIIAEMIMVSNFNRSWHPLLGSPAQPVARDVLLLAWIGAPAMFSRRLS